MSQANGAKTGASGIKVAVVTTTIYVPKCLDDYFANAVTYGHADTLFVVTGDTKTPVDAKSFCAEASARHGVTCVFMDVEDQKAYMAKYPEFDAHLPWRCIQRRNVSILYAYEQGCDVIIAIDDDNYVLPGTDFVGTHLAGLSLQENPLTSLCSSSGWLNVCKYLKDHRGVPFYPRGYPMEERWPKVEPVIRTCASPSRAVVNAGLWLDDPDVDAITRLCNDIVATEYTRDSSYVMANGTWCPFNSQNTAFHRDLIPAYVLSPLIGRMDDIWASYVALRIMDHLGHGCVFGHPLVTQDRNPHNYFVDHEKERIGLEAGGILCKILRSIVLTHQTYFSCGVELIDKLEAAAAASEELKPNAGAVKWVNDMISTYRAWFATMRRLGAQ